MPTHAVLSLYIWQIYHNTWIFPGLESRERLSDPKQKVFLITITTKGKQNQCNPKAGEDEVLKIRIQREPVLICLQIMKIKLRNYRHNFLERCHIKTYGISRSKDDDWNIRQIHGLTALLRWEGLGVIPQEQVLYPFLQVQKVGSAWWIKEA